MNQQMLNKNPKIFLFGILLAVLGFSCSILFDIPFIRQVFCFLYLSFIPGFIFLKLLKLDRLNVAEKFFVSLGLSISFLMIVGLLTNEILPIFGFNEPLSTLPLMVVINCTVVIGTFLLYFRGQSIQITEIKNFRKYLGFLPFLLLPFVSIIGAIWVNAYNNNIILLVLIIFIAVLFVCGIFSKKLLPAELFPFAVLMFALAILFHAALISNYIVPFASDVPYEYLVFKTAQDHGSWNSLVFSASDVGLNRYNGMLSISILPTIFSNLLNLDSSFVLKLIFPILFSFVPVGLFEIWQKYIDKKYAFGAAFLFMSQITFYTEMFGVTRQMIAEVFFVLLILVILNKKIKPISKYVVFTIFCFGLVTSHYALATIFLFLISFTFVLLFILKRPSINISIGMIATFIVIMFTWYIYTSGSATFDSIIGQINYVVSQLGEFLNPASRGQTVLAGLGLVESPSIWNTISRIFAYFTQGFIVLGFVGLVTRRVKNRIGKEFFIFSIFATVLLALLVLVPGLAKTLNMTRFYHILLIFLSPLLVLGMKFFGKILLKKEHVLLTLLILVSVLVPYFLFQTNFVYEVTGSDSWSVPLSGYRMDNYRLYYKIGYTDEYSVSGARWVSENVDYVTNEMYADESTQTNVLMLHGLIHTSYVHSLMNTTVLAENGYVYLSSINVRDDIIPTGSVVWNSSELSFNFNDLNKIYSNPYSEVYKNNP